MTQEDKKEDKSKAKEPKIQVEPHLRCNFCGKDAARVFMLIQGPSVNICDECVLQCTGLIGKEIVRRETKLNKVTSFKPEQEET
jgi:hypothetical protein